jgi:AraC-like DNA-binding protein
MPTDAQRSLVESASAFGITQAEIATQLKISEPTLRKHFRDELDFIIGRYFIVSPPRLVHHSRRWLSDPE